MKALVTGGTGFTGKALVRRLVDCGHHVVVLDNKEGLKCHEIRAWGAEVVIGSIVDRAVVARCIQGVEVVFHLAAAFREVNMPPAYYQKVNVEGTRNILAAAAERAVSKVIYCSTCGVHGNVENPPAGEDAPISPADYYQQTKYDGERVVEDFVRQGLKAITLRPAAIYGPGDPERFLMIYRRVATGRFPMFGSGTTYYHPLYIDNLTDAFMLAYESDIGDGRAYLIADEHYVDLKTLVMKIGEAMNVEVKIAHFPLWPIVVAGHVCETLCTPFGVKPPIFPRRVDWFRQNRAFRIDNARRELGYQPKVGLEEGLRRTAEWYYREGYL